MFKKCLGIIHELCVGWRRCHIKYKNCTNYAEKYSIKIDSILTLPFLKVRKYVIRLFRH